MAERSWRRRGESVTASLGEVHIVGEGPDGGSIRAAVGSLYQGRTRKAADFDQTWEEQLTIMYRDGRPGIFGSLLDVEAQQCAKLGVEVRRIDGEAVPPTITKLFASMFRGIDGEAPEMLVERGVRLMRRGGRFAVVFADSPSGARASIYSIAALSASRQRNPATGKIEDGYLLGREIKDRKAPAEAQPRWIPKAQVREVWVPDDDDPTQPYTPYARCVDSLRTLRLVGRRVTRDTNAYLAGSRAMWFKGTANDLVRRNTGGNSNVQGPLAVTIENVMAAMEANLNDTSETEVRSAVIIPIVSPEAPEMLELVAPLDPGVIDVWDRALKDFALATPWPTLWVTDGTGAGNHWTDKLAQEEGRQLVVYPVMTQFCALLTVALLRPILRAAQVADADDYELGYEPADIDGEGLTVEEARQAWQDGLISREKYAQVMGIAPEDMLQVDAGIDDFDMWQATRDGYSQWWTREMQDKGKIPYSAPRTYNRSSATMSAPVPAAIEAEARELTSGGGQWWE